MLDVHPPHAPTHTWKDFFIHVGTICVGLLIAVGLEQSIEAINRHRERDDLRESLQHESEQILRDTTRVENAVSSEITWQREVDQVLSDAFQRHHPIGPLPPENNFEDFDIPDNPIYKAAKASNKLALLSQQEAEAYGEMDSLLEQTSRAYSHRADSIRALLEGQRALRLSQPIPASVPEGSFLISTHGFAALAGLSLPNEDLKKIYNDSASLEVSSEEFRYWSRQTRGAATALEQGERNLHKIEDAERQFANLP